MLLLVYGSLRRFHHNHKAMGLAEEGVYLGTLRVRGLSLFNVNWFPACVKDTDNQMGVVCELYEIAEPSFVSRLDQYEACDAESPRQSLFVRRLIKLNDGRLAEIYLWNSGTSMLEPIESGDWKEYVEADNASRIRLRA